MKKLYQAENGLDAKLVSDLLTRFGIENEIRGQHLQGGIGILPVSEFVHVYVNEKNFNEARKLTAAWEIHQSLPDPEENYAAKTSPPQNDWGNFIIGFIAAVICVASIAYVGSP